MLPPEAEKLFDIVGITHPFSLLKDRDGIVLSLYSTISFDDARQKLLELIQVLRSLTEKEKIEISEDLVFEAKMEELKPEYYLTAYRKYLKPIFIKGKLLVIPAGAETKLEEINLDVNVIVLDSLLAFGTGSHPTTKMCLEYLVENDIVGKTVVDAGTGSGILAIVAARLGADRVYALDIDPVAVTVARKNSVLNSVDDKVEILEAGLELLPELEADVIIANLTASIIEDGYIFFKNAKAKTLVISGFLKKEKRRIEELFSRDFIKVGEKHLSGWVLQEFRRG
jgi:ribosomal protein L11 methyltransferase